MRAQGLHVGVVLAVLFASAPCAAFVAEGHKVLETMAYREMGSSVGPNGARAADLDVLADLTRDGVFEKPICFERTSEDCAARFASDPLAWWLTPHTDTPDRILARQFDSVGQCFHFMAQSGDEEGAPYTTPSGANPHASYGLIWDAYDRCIDQIERLVANVVEDPAIARRGAVGMYELMHAIMDSYSRAHVEREYAAWTPGQATDPKIAFLKVWQPTVPNPFGGEHQNTRHEIFEPRDDDFIERFRVVDGRPCTFYVPRPYSMPASCLSTSGRLAVDALKDLMRVVHALRARVVTTSHATWETLDHAAWGAFVSKHFAHVPAPERAPNHLRPSAERIETPFLFLGTRALFVPETKTTDVGMFGRYVLTSGHFDPISLGMSLELGGRHDFRARTQSFMVRQDVEMLLTLGDSVVLGVTPFSIGYFASPQHNASIEVVTRLGRVEWFEPFGARRLALTVWGPAEYSWLDEEARWTFGLGVAGALLEHVPGAADAALRSPKREPTTGLWRPPEPWASELGSTSGPILVGAYAGVTSGARGGVTGADGKLHEGLELTFFRRNWWRELNPASFSVLLDDAIDVTAGAAPHTSLGAYGSGRLYFFGPLGAILTAGADTGDLSGAKLRPASVQGRGGLVLSLGDLDLIVESPTLPRYSFLAHELFTARIAFQLFSIRGR